jgi:hypothetical protein
MKHIKIIREFENNGTIYCEVNKKELEQKLNFILSQLED